MPQAALILLQAVIVALLIRIAVVDFKTQRIANRDVLALAGLAAVRLTLWAAQAGNWWLLYLAAAIASVFFVVLLPFWLGHKVGAGDVKLMAVAPLVSGAENMLAFALLLLLFSVITTLVVRNPMLMPTPLFRQYIQHFERKGVVPFGVPIAASLIGVELLRTFAMPSLM
jgi:prepilin peptidase CpaA